MGGVASVAEWLLAHEDEIGCRYDPFDLWRPPDMELGGRLRLASFALQARLLLRFVRWLRTAPRLVHYCVACTITGLTRDLLFVALLRLTGRKTIAHVHGSSLVIAKQSRFRSVALRLLSRLSVERVAIAPRSSAALAGLGISSRCVFNPIRLEPYARSSQPRSSTLRLLFVGWYGKRKGCGELIEALARVRASGTDATLRFVGREEHRGEEQELRRQVRAHGLERAVEFAGAVPREQLRHCYENADGICLPSWREGLPMALLEGMAFGLPVVATAVGGIPDLVEDGTSGLLVEPGDVEGLTAAIRRLADNPKERERMGAAARARARAAASPEVISAQWQTLYAEYAER